MINLAIPSLELQKSIFSRLSGSTYKVYDVPPLGSFTQPFIVIGDETITTRFTKTERFWVSTVTIHTWTKGASSSSSKTLNNFVIENILLKPFNVNGFFVSLVSLEMLTTQEEMDETQSQTIFHGILQFEFTLQEVI